MAIWNPNEHSEEENRRWCWLRAIEWGRWPVFISQPIYPLLLLIVPWYILTLSILVINILWSYLIKYRHINISLAAFGPLFVKLKWITCPLMAIYFFYHGDKLTAALALFWPVLIFVIGAFPLTKTGLIQKLFLNKLSIVEIRAPLKDLPDTNAYLEEMASKVRLETIPEGFRSKTYTLIKAAELGKVIFANCVLGAEKTLLHDIYDKYKDKPEFQKEIFERQKYVFLSANIAVAITAACEKRPEFSKVIPAFRELVIKEMVNRWGFSEDLNDFKIEEAAKELMHLLFTDPDKDRGLSFEWAQKWLKYVGVEEDNPITLLNFSGYWKLHFAELSKLIAEHGFIKISNN